MFHDLIQSGKKKDEKKCGATNTPQKRWVVMDVIHKGLNSHICADLPVSFRHEADWNQRLWLSGLTSFIQKNVSKMSHSVENQSTNNEVQFKWEIEKLQYTLSTTQDLLDSNIMKHASTGTGADHNPVESSLTDVFSSLRVRLQHFWNRLGGNRH